MRHPSRHLRDNWGLTAASQRSRTPAASSTSGGVDEAARHLRWAALELGVDANAAGATGGMAPGPVLARPPPEGWQLWLPDTADAPGQESESPGPGDPELDQARTQLPESAQAPSSPPDAPSAPTEHPDKAGGFGQASMTTPTPATPAPTAHAGTATSSSSTTSAC